MLDQLPAQYTLAVSQNIYNLFDNVQLHLIVIFCIILLQNHYVVYIPNLCLSLVEIRKFKKYLVHFPDINTLSQSHKFLHTVNVLHCYI